MKTDRARQTTLRSGVALRERVTPKLQVVKIDAYKYSRHLYKYCQSWVVVYNFCGSESSIYMLGRLDTVHLEFGPQNILEGICWLLVLI